MILQNCKYTLKMKSTITIEDCDNLTGTTSLIELDKLWSRLNNSTIYDIDKITKNVLYEGINLNDLLKYLKNKIMNSKMSDTNKSKIITDILTINTKLMEKANEYLQLLYLFSSIMICFTN